MILLLDNTVLSNFALVGRTDLLPIALPLNVSTTPQVMDEFRTGVERGKLPPTNLGWIETVRLNDRERMLFEQHLIRVNSGEAACLAVAECRNGRILTDDRDARKLAAQLKIPVSGTLGILLKLVQMGELSLNQANDILRQLIVKGYRSPVDRLDELHARLA